MYKEKNKGINIILFYLIKKKVVIYIYFLYLQIKRLNNYHFLFIMIIWNLYNIKNNIYLYFNKKRFKQYCYFKKK